MAHTHDVYVYWEIDPASVVRIAFDLSVPGHPVFHLAANPVRPRMLIRGNHGHWLPGQVFTFPLADIIAAVDKTYDLTGGALHGHSVTLTAANMITLGNQYNGGALRDIDLLEQFPLVVASTVG